MKLFVFAAVFGLAFASALHADTPQISEEGKACLECHGDSTPGIVEQDYTQWHSFFEVSKIFYTEFIPEAEQLLPGVTSDVVKSDYHKWTAGLSKEKLQQQIDFYKERYKQ